MKNMWLFVLLVVLYAPTHFEAQQVDYANSGGQLLSECQTLVENPQSSGFLGGYCLGLVTGVALASPHINPPADSTAIQDVRIVIAYMQSHPERLHLRNSELVREALEQVWPATRIQKTDPTPVNKK